MMLHLPPRIGLTTVSSNLLTSWHIHRLLCCRLSGCIPVPAQDKTIFADNTTGTSIQGRCPTQRAEVEGRQRAALGLLPALFSTAGEAWQRQVRNVLQSAPSLSDFYANASGSTAVFSIEDPTSPTYNYVQIQLDVVNGAFCITGIDAQNVGVNTTVLTQFLKQVPFLKSFRGSKLGWDMPAMPIPLDLAAAAPASLTSFELTRNNLVGALPPQWGGWSTIQVLVIRTNEILTGVLPESWAGMRSLTSLTLSGNPSITGPLPASYGTAAWATKLTELDLSSDTNLNGTIPSSWSNLKAKIRVQNTALGGCIPDQLLNTLLIQEQPADLFGVFTGPCSRNSSELTALQELKAVLGGSNPGLATWTAAPPEYTPIPLPGECTRAATQGMP